MSEGTPTKLRIGQLFDINRAYIDSIAPYLFNAMTLLLCLFVAVFAEDIAELKHNFAFNHVSIPLCGFALVGLWLTYRHHTFIFQQKSTIETLKEQHAHEIEDLKSSSHSKIAYLKTKYERETQAVYRRCKREMANQKREYEAKQTDFQRNIKGQNGYYERRLKAVYSEYTQDVARIRHQHNHELDHQKVRYERRLKAARGAYSEHIRRIKHQHQHGLAQFKATMYHQNLSDNRKNFGYMADDIHSLLGVTKLSKEGDVFFDFSQIVCMAIKRAVMGIRVGTLRRLGQPSQDESITVELMTAVASSVSDKETVPVKAHSWLGSMGYTGEVPQACPHNCVSEYRQSSAGPNTYLICVSNCRRSYNGSHYFIVPAERAMVQPGPPRAFLYTKEYYPDRTSYSPSQVFDKAQSTVFSIPDISKLSTHPEFQRVTEPDIECIQRLYKQQSPSIDSILSIGLVYNDEAVGVLNIKCGSVGLYEDITEQCLLRIFVAPYLPLAAKAAAMARNEITSWRSPKRHQDIDPWTVPTRPNPDPTVFSPPGAAPSLETQSHPPSIEDKNSLRSGLKNS